MNLASVARAEGFVRVHLRPRSYVLSSNAASLETLLPSRIAAWRDNMRFPRSVFSYVFPND